MRHRMLILGLAASLVAACSSDSSRNVVVGDRPGQGGAGVAGTSAYNPNGTGGAAGTGVTSTALEVDVQDPAGMVIEIVTLGCDGECADIVAVARNGHAPYTYRWEDGSTNPNRRVCLSADAQLTVTATDTPLELDGRLSTPMMASAQVTADVLECGQPPGECGERAPAGSFDPVVKWEWTAGASAVTPLVGNLTDDNGDGAVDLLDVPDVVVTVGPLAAEIVVLDGATGAEHFRIPGVDGLITPALGDIDGDGKVEIVTASTAGTLVAFRNDGTLLWTGDALTAGFEAASFSLANLDAQGAPEIVVGGAVYDATGTLLWRASGTENRIATSTAADLDGDGLLEVVWGNTAFQHDGTPYHDNAEVTAASGGRWVFPAIADLDGDGSPEVIVATQSTLFVLDRFLVTLRTAALAGISGYPPAVADLDGDGLPEILLSDGAFYRAFDGDLIERWASPVQDFSSCAAGTAFDFLGDGTAEAMYADETTSWGFDGITGEPIFRSPRSSGTQIEYPTVADVDADGSADILIVSNPFFGATQQGLQVISDREGRWVPARRIMNQDTYHVTNINDDGTIPVHEQPHWKLNNSFRAQAQINPDGAVCIPNL